MNWKRGWKRLKISTTKIYSSSSRTKKRQRRINHWKNTDSPELPHITTMHWLQVILLQQSQEFPRGLAQVQLYETWLNKICSTKNPRANKDHDVVIREIHCIGIKWFELMNRVKATHRITKHYFGSFGRKPRIQIQIDSLLDVSFILGSISSF